MERSYGVWEKLRRRKPLEDVKSGGPLNRCLGIPDLVFLGLGQMIGSGIFVLTGVVMRDIAGPAVMLSYLVAAVGSLFSALSYAEFAAKVPIAGSAYSYTYVTMGEACAFFIGWNMQLEYILSASVGASAISGTLNAVFNNAVLNFTKNHIGTLSAIGLAPVPDFLALFVILFVFVFVVIGLKVGKIFSSIISVLTLLGIILIVIIGFTHADVKNWTNHENGGFFPFGVVGVFSGAASCFYAYAGFDSIAAAGEEAKNPQKSMPIAIIVSVVVVACLYILTSTSLSLLIPYNLVNLKAPFPMAFDYIGLSWAKYIVVVDSISAITCATYINLFAVSRVTYVMANDGLLFKFLAYVNPHTQTPVWSTVVCTSLAGALATILDLQTLVELMSIGTLFAYTMVSTCVLILRYRPVINDGKHALLERRSSLERNKKAIPSTSVDQELLVVNNDKEFGRLKSVVSFVPVLKDMPPGRAVTLAGVVIIVLTAALFGLCWHGTQYLVSGAWWALTILTLLLLGVGICCLIIIAHVRNDSYDTFMVPLVPFLPIASIFYNMMLILKLQYRTWIRALVWLVIGCIIYYAYGISHSKESKTLVSSASTVSYGSGNDSASLVTENKQLPDTEDVAD